jgi:hypothetical protein
VRSEQAIFSLLTNDAGVSAIVGTRVFPRGLPQNHTLPALVYQLISAPRELTHSGPETLVEARVQITAHATTYAAAKTLQNAVQVASDGFTGTPASVTVQATRTEDGPDQYDPKTETEQAIIDILISYQET